MVMYSKEYQNKLKEEIKLLEQKKALINRQNNPETKLTDYVFDMLLKDINNKIKELIYKR